VERHAFDRGYEGERHLSHEDHHSAHDRDCIQPRATTLAGVFSR
jgi:hypothetical protein